VAKEKSTGDTHQTLDDSEQRPEEGQGLRLPGRYSSVAELRVRLPRDPASLGTGERADASRGQQTPEQDLNDSDTQKPYFQSQPRGRPRGELEINVPFQESTIQGGKNGGLEFSAELFEENSKSNSELRLSRRPSVPEL
jgi:hypothetical protein